MITSLSLVIAPHRLRLVAWLMVALWTLALAASVVWNVRLLRKTMVQVATQEARSSCNKDVLYRRWAASHGGVYVPATATTPPNPYLTNVVERDLLTPSGRRLTLVNPAYMTRQVHELGEQYGSSGHITSLKPLRPENAPDAWEAAALQAFGQGQTEVLSQEPFHGRLHLRFMRPLVTEAACLKCHAAQGYKEGDIRGGLSVAVPLDPYLALAQAKLWPIAGAHIGLWALGMLGIGWGARQMRQRLDQQLQAAAALRASEERFRTVADFTADMEYWRLPDGSLAYMSPSCERLTGYSAAEFLQAPELLARIVHPEDRQRCEGHFHGVSETTAGPEQCELEFRIRTRSGEVRWIGHVCQPVVDREGKFQGRRASNRDLTERKHAEAALRESEEAALSNNALLHSIMESPQDMVIFALDTSYRYTAFTQAHRQTMRAIWGVEIEAGINMLDAIPNSDAREQARRNFDRALQGHHFIAVEDYGDPALRRTTYEDRYGPIHDPAGVVSGLTVFVTDITERKLAEQALRESEERFRNLLRDVPGVAVQGYRMDGTTTYWNQASEVLYGYTAQDAVGRNLIDLVIPPEMREGVRQAMRQMAETGQPIPASDLSLMRKDGSRVAVFSSHVIVQIPGRAVELFCLDIDLTGRKQAEAALRQSEEQLRNLFENAPVGIFHSTPEGRLLTVNPVLAALLGYASPEALIAATTDMTTQIYADPTIRPLIVETLLKADGWIHYDEVTWQRNDGSRITVDMTGRKVLNAAGGIAYLEGFVEDITERQRAEAALRESEDRFRGVVEGAAMPIFVTVGMKFSYLNPAALRLLGATTPEQVLGQPVLSRIHPDYHESIQKRAVKVFQGQRGVAPPQAEIYLKLDGTPVPVEATASPITYQDQPAAVVFVQDITERQRLEEANTLLEAQFRQAQKLEAIGQLAGGIAHDFNNILAAILGNTDLAVMDTDPSHPARESLEEIKKAGVRAKGLVQQILTYSRQQPQDRQVISLEPIIAEAAKFLHATIPAGVEIVLALAASAPPVLADATQIHQVIFNLCTNAWHALEDQPGRITIQLRAVTLDAAATERLAGLRPGSFACLTISDTGKGMDAATLEHIFNPFFTTKAPGKGTGLGLSVVQGIIAAHDGAITVVSQPGQGTTFQVYFPAAFARTDDSEIAPGGPAPQGQGQHVLFLDDEEALVNLAMRTLEPLGYRVTGFTQAAVAMQAFRANPGQFDVVITDLNMPGISGLDVARELLTVQPEVPILLCSGHVTEQMQAQAHSAGIRHILYKPNTMEEVSATLHRLFTQPQQPGPHL
jgi:PAS domain S-box-containing protein